jgi:hypothetical protein
VAEKSERSKTTYEVSTCTQDDTGPWHVVGTTEANNGLDAIRSLAKTPGYFRAVPVRNITEQAMGNPPPEPPKLVPVDPDQLAIPADAFVEPPVEGHRVTEDDGA